MQQTKWDTQHIQQVLDHLSLGHIVSVAYLDKKNLQIRNSEVKVLDQLSQKEIIKQASIAIEEIIARTNNGIFYVLVTDPVEERFVFTLDQNILDSYKKHLHLKTIITKDFVPTDYLVHQFGKYFYVFSL